MSPPCRNGGLGTESPCSGEPECEVCGLTQRGFSSFPGGESHTSKAERPRTDGLNRGQHFLFVLEDF